MKTKHTWYYYEDQTYLVLLWRPNTQNCSSERVCVFSLHGGPKNGLFLRSDNFATTDDRKACNMSKVW